MKMADFDVTYRYVGERQPFVIRVSADTEKDAEKQVREKFWNPLAVGESVIVIRVAPAT
jgi:hypothetical protein